MEKSKGHICFAKQNDNPEIVRIYEFFIKNGSVYRAPLSDVVMPDGFRSGDLMFDPVALKGKPS